MINQSILLTYSDKEPELGEISEVLEIVLDKFLTNIIKSEDNKSIGIEEVSEKIASLYVRSDSLKTLIIYSAEKLTIEAQNILLKTLEELPNNSIIILISNKPEQLLTTVKSRVKTFSIRSKGMKLDNANDLLDKILREKNSILRKKIFEELLEKESIIKLKLIIEDYYGMIVKETRNTELISRLKKLIQYLNRPVNKKLVISYFNSLLQK